MLSSSAKEATPPSRMLPDSPVRPCASCGKPQSGPRRGNSTNSTNITGSPRPAARADRPAARLRAGRPTGMWASTWAVSRPHTAIKSHKPVSRDCEYKKCVSTRKKPRKNTTRASRRARSSKVLSDISTTSSVMPAALPSKVFSPQKVSADAAMSKLLMTQRLGSAAAVKARRARQASRVTDITPHQGGRCSRWGAMVQAMTAS